MAEYIEREKAIAICQSYYEHCLETHDYCGDSVAYDIRTNIQGLPTADVVPVVRCKDCVFWDTESTGFSDEHICKMHSIVAVHSRYTNPTDYCSYGERQGNK